MNANSMGNSDGDEAKKNEEEWKSQYYEMYYEEYSWIPEVFKPLAGVPSQKHSEAMADEIATVCGAVTEDETVGISTDVGGGTMSDKALEHHKNASDSVENWVGNAATEFRSNFLTDFPGVIDNQVAVTKLLCAAALANGALMKNTRKAVRATLDDAITAVEDSADSGGSDLVLTLAFVGGALTVVAGIAAAPVSGGTSLAPAIAAGATILAGVAGTGGSVASLFEGEKELPLDGDTVDDVLQNVRDAVDMISEDLKEGESALGKVMSTASDFIYDEVEQMVARRPGGLVDVSDPTDNLKPPPSQA